jgi:thiamine transport system substrate-binding protein
MTKTTKNPALAQQFLSFLLSNEAQAILPVTNWMLPVVNDVDLPPVFKDLIQPKGIGFSNEDIAKNRKEWISEWRTNAVKE